MSAISLTGNGTGYIDTPLVTITGGTLAAGGVAATAVANFDYTTGQVTGITITNPGDYTSTSGLGVTFKGGNGSASIAPTMNAISTGANSSGGMTFQGNGTTTLSNANTYTGDTKVTAGTLAFSNNLAIQNSAFDTSGGGIYRHQRHHLRRPERQHGSGDGYYDRIQQRYLADTESRSGVSDSYSGVIANGGMKVTKTGNGTQILSGANLYAGLTSVSAGTLRVNNTIGSGTGTGNVTVAASTSSGNYTGGMLGGSGNVSGAGTLVGNATAKLGGIIAAGADSSTVGTLTTGNQTWNGGAAYEWKITNSGSVAVGSASPATPRTTY